MNISNTIREQRNKLSMSQDELGERIYVSRQTISSWENGKTYPDINSLVMLSEVFGMTIDNLVKGDLEIMEKKIEEIDIRDYNRYSAIMIAGIFLAAVLMSASWHLAFIPGLVTALICWLISFYFSLKIEKIKKQYNVQTYREIVAFTKGEKLDEISKIRESGKRGYQNFLKFIGGALFGIIVSVIIGLILGVA